MRERCGTGVQRFLEACRIPAAEMAQTIELAHAIAGKSGTPLLRVQFEDETASVSATRPGSPIPHAPPHLMPAYHRFRYPHNATTWPCSSGAVGNGGRSTQAAIPR